MKKGITTKNQIHDFRLYIDLANPEGDIGTETVWYENKIVDSKIIKRDEKDS